MNTTSKINDLTQIPYSSELPKEHGIIRNVIEGKERDEIMVMDLLYPKSINGIRVDLFDFIKPNGSIEIVTESGFSILFEEVDNEIFLCKKVITANMLGDFKDVIVTIKDCIPETPIGFQMVFVEDEEGDEDEDDEDEDFNEVEEDQETPKPKTYIVFEEIGQDKDTEEEEQEDEEDEDYEMPEIDGDVEFVKNIYINEVGLTIPTKMSKFRELDKEFQKVLSAKTNKELVLIAGMTGRWKVFEIINTYHDLNAREWKEIVLAACRREDMENAYRIVEEKKIKNYRDGVVFYSYIAQYFLLEEGNLDKFNEIVAEQNMILAYDFNEEVKTKHSYLTQNQKFAKFGSGGIID